MANDLVENEIRAKIEDFGFELRTNLSHCSEFTMPVKNGYVYFKRYFILPGLEVYYNDMRTTDLLSGELAETINMYQLAYCHSGLYEANVDKVRRVCLHSKDGYIGHNVYEFSNANLPLTYYEGFSIALYPDAITQQTREILVPYGIDLPDIVKNMIKDRKFCKFNFPKHIKDILEDIFDLSKQGDIDLLKKALLKLFTILKDFDAGDCFSYTNLSVNMVDKMLGVRKYIEENMDKHISIAELSDRFKISASALKQNFKKVYGYPPYEFLKRSRMELAVRRLIETDKPISVISKQIGYMNASKFSSAFAGIYHVTPREFRKNNRVDYLNSLYE